MKFYFIFLIVLIHINCIQKQNSFEDQRLLLSALAVQPSGTPKSFGLNMLINNRIGRGCETRMGNLAADAYANKAGATIGFFTSGGIRDDFGIKGTYATGIIPKGTVPTVDLFKKFLPFQGGNLLRLNIQAYRIKQALESASNRLNSRGERNTDDLDEDGATHGNCWLNPNVSGSGRFFQLSNKFQIEINPSATALVVTGSGAANSLRVTTEGRRVIRIILDGILLYNNSSGDINSGWSNGTGSCTIKGVTFTSSAACNYYSLATDKFQYDGGDSNPSLNPNMLEVSNDGSVQILNSGIASNVDDATILYEYMQTFTTGPAMPKISNRIIMP